MPMFGEVFGTLKTIKLDKANDFVRYLSIYYTDKSIVGLKVATDLGESYTLGTVTGPSPKTFTFDKESLLVGFFGNRSNIQINSLGVIYLDSACLPKVALSDTVTAEQPTKSEVTQTTAPVPLD
jgi:Jacalin-like lectin domain